MRIQFVPALLLCVSGLAADVLTYHNDNARTGQNLSETVLTPINVGVNTFGKLFNISVDGKVDAELLYASAVSFPSHGTRNALYVVTEHDSVYAFDADSGVQLWKVSTLQSGESTSDARNCDQVSPEIGITSTPVISRTIGAHGTIYVVAMSLDSSGHYHHRLHGLDLTTGAEQFSGPMEVQATYPGTGDKDGTNVIFDPAQYKDRAALLLLNGVVYTSLARARREPPRAYRNERQSGDHRARHCSRTDSVGRRDPTFQIQVLGETVASSPVDAPKLTAVTLPLRSTARFRYYARERVQSNRPTKKMAPELLEVSRQLPRPSAVALPSVARLPLPCAATALRSHFLRSRDRKQIANP